VLDVPLPETISTPRWLEYLNQNTLANTIAEIGEDHVFFSVDYPYESNEDACDWYGGIQMNQNTMRAVALENAKKSLRNTR